MLTTGVPSAIACVTALGHSLNQIVRNGPKLLSVKFLGDFEWNIKGMRFYISQHRAETALLENEE